MSAPAYDRSGKCWRDAAALPANAREGSAARSPPSVCASNTGWAAARRRSSLHEGGAGRWGQPPTKASGCRVGPGEPANQGRIVPRGKPAQVASPHPSGAQWAPSAPQRIACGGWARGSESGISGNNRWGFVKVGRLVCGRTTPIVRGFASATAPMHVWKAGLVQWAEIEEGGVGGLAASKRHWCAGASALGGRALNLCAPAADRGRLGGGPCATPTPSAEVATGHWPRRQRQCACCIAPAARASGAAWRGHICTGPKPQPSGAVVGSPGGARP